MSEEKVLVSIVMPILNGVPYFEEALESVINQTLSQIEIIVVDAGSTDGTKEYVESVAKKDSRVKLIESDQKSMGRQYNIGMQVANGDYIAFCEGDDYLELEMMDELYTVAKQHDFPDAVKSNFFMFINEGSNMVELEYKVLPFKSRDLYDRELSLYSHAGIYNSDGNMWNAIYNRDFLIQNNIKFNETPAAAFQDAGFIAQVMMFSKRQYYIDKAFYHYRRDNAESSMLKDTSKFWAWETVFVLDIIEKNYKDLEDILDVILERLYHRLFASFAKDLYMNKSSLDNRDVRAAVKKIYEMCQKPSSAMKTFTIDFEDGCKSFDETAHFHLKDYTVKMNRVRIFRELVKESGKVVIFGAGEMGKTMCAFLKKNQYSGLIGFCDNAPKSTTIMGCKVYTVPEAIKEHGDALFVITNREHLEQMKPQLLSSGIKSTQICILDTIVPHSSMEIDWDMI